MCFATKIVDCYVWQWRNGQDMSRTCTRHGCIHIYSVSPIPGVRQSSEWHTEALQQIRSFHLDLRQNMIKAAAYLTLQAPNIAIALLDC